jgi:hypothetical protein
LPPSANDPSKAPLAEGIGAIHEIEAVGLTAPYKSLTGWEE